MQNLPFNKSYGDTHANITRLFLKPGKQPVFIAWLVYTDLTPYDWKKSYVTVGSQDSI